MIFFQNHLFKYYKSFNNNNAYKIFENNNL